MTDEKSDVLDALIDVERKWWTNARNNNRTLLSDVADLMIAREKKLRDRIAELENMVVLK